MTRSLFCCAAPERARDKRKRRVTCGGLVAVLLHTTFVVAADATPEKALNAKFRGEIKPFVQKFCSDCHSGAKPEGGLDLGRFGQASTLRDERATWQKVVLRLRSEEMPPEDQEQPSADARQRFMAAVNSALAGGVAAPRNPGRVTMRRLNRTEYNNTVRDLLGVDVHPANDFPADDVGYGFDNIGDVLSTPPLLLERYLATARKIAEAAIVAPGAPPVVADLVGKKLHSSAGGSSIDSGGRELGTNGEVFGDAHAADEGEYVVRILAHADQAGDEPAKMELRIDKAARHVFDVTAVSTPELYEFKTPIKSGKHRVAAAFINDYYEPDNPDPLRRDRNLMVDRIEVCGPIEIAYAKLPESHRRIIRRDVAEHRGNPSAQLKDAEEFLKRFASRAFRRPASKVEIERLVKLVNIALDEGDSFEQGMRLAVEATLASPHFLYRVELDPAPAAPGQIYPISEYELANRLSYFLWSTMPDDELFAVAWKGELRKDANLEAQVQRMLRDPKSRAFVENFAGQWLQLRLVRSLSPDAKGFASFDESLRSAMVRETELFFASILDENRSVLDFLDADYTFVNERLARHYGLPDVHGDEFRRVSLAGDQRGGLLGQASILSVTSNPTRTSPVKRGRWVLENLLGAAPPPAPPDIPALEEKAGGPLQGSLRERMTLHREKAECSICHKPHGPPRLWPGELRRHRRLAVGGKRQSRSMPRARFPAADRSMDRASSRQF